MSDLQLYNEFHSLPEELRKEVADFIKFLKSKRQKTRKLKERKFGALKGKIRMSKDFDAPLADFKEYME